MSGCAEFRQGSFERTGLPSRSADAVMTVDALQYAPDKAEALAEVARILRPGRRFAFLAFELDAQRVAGLPSWNDPVGDYRPLLEAARFEVVTYEQTPGWETQVANAFTAIAAADEQLEAELGPAAARALALEASITLAVQPYRGHVSVVAELGPVAGGRPS